MLKGVVVFLSVLGALSLFISLQDVDAQGRQKYPKIDEEEYIEVKPGEKYNCPGCKIVFQATEFTVWERPGGDRVVVAVPITDNTTFVDESFVYNYCFTGIKHVIPGQCDDPEYEQYKVPSEDAETPEETPEEPPSEITPDTPLFG